MVKSWQVNDFYNKLKTSCFASCWGLIGLHVFVSCRHHLWEAVVVFQPDPINKLFSMVCSISYFHITDWNHIFMLRFTVSSGSGEIWAVCTSFTLLTCRGVLGALIWHIEPIQRERIKTKRAYQLQAPASALLHTLTCFTPGEPPGRWAEKEKASPPILHNPPRGHSRSEPCHNWHQENIFQRSSWRFWLKEFSLLSGDSSINPVNSWLLYALNCNIGSKAHQHMKENLLV